MKKSMIVIKNLGEYDEILLVPALTGNGKTGNLTLYRIMKVKYK